MYLLLTSGITPQMTTAAPRKDGAGKLFHCPPTHSYGVQEKENLGSYSSGILLEL